MLIFFANFLPMESKPKTNTYTEEGRILQVEYAIKNVTKAPTMLGLVCTDGLILLGYKSTPNQQREKIFKVSNNIHLGIAGLFSDAIQLIGHARVESEEYKEYFEDEISVQSLANALGGVKQRFTISGGKRPFGVSILYGGSLEDEFVLYCTDPSGSVSRWKGLCIGENDEQINTKLREIGDIDIKQGTKKIIGILKSCKDCTEKDVEKLEILHMFENKRIFLSKEEIMQYLNEQ